MGSLKKRRKAKINKHKRSKRMRQNRQEAFALQVLRFVRFAAQTGSLSDFRKIPASSLSRKDAVFYVFEWAKKY